MSDIVKSSGNRLLDALLRDGDKLRPHLELVNFPLGHIVCLQDRALSHVYFPIRGSLLSLLVLLEDGGSAEAMVVSNEGMVGVSVWLGITASLSQIVLQAPGPLLRISSQAFCAGIHGSAKATTLMKRFTAYSLRSGYQTAVCNAHHTIEQRTCRWILATEDRVGKETIQLSQAMVAHMLGARRQSVGEVAVKMQRDGLITYQRTHLQIVNRAGLEKRSCECYFSLRRAYRVLIESTL